ncbi:MAG: hypothetical protein IJ800_06890, partial [Clostridia bacterium]|nr:hypothetical protein [Clostridia bacterium]
ADVEIGEPYYYEETGLYEFRAVISSIPEEKYATDLTARGYITISNGEESKTGYTKALTRNISYVAKCALEYEGDEDADIIALLEEFRGEDDYYAISTSEGVNGDLKFARAGTTVGFSVEDKQDLAAYGIEENGSVQNSYTLAMPSRDISVKAVYRAGGTQVVDLSEGKLDLSAVSGLTSSDVSALKVGANAITVSDETDDGELSFVKPSTVSTIARNTAVDFTVVADEVYLFTATAYDMVVDTADEYKTFAAAYKDNQPGEYYVLNADIDLEGYNVATQANQNISYTWRATFDGRGHIIYAPATVHGLFTTVTGTLKNLGLVSPLKATPNGGGLMVNELGGAMLDCFVIGSVTYSTQGGLYGSGAGTAQRNVGIISRPLSVTSGYGVSNVKKSGDNYIVSKDITNTYASSTDGLYTSVSALVSDKASALNGQGYWTVKSGVLYFGEHPIKDAVSAVDVDLSKNTAYSAASLGLDSTKLQSVMLPTVGTSATYYSATPQNGSFNLNVGSTASRGSAYAIARYDDGTFDILSAYIADMIISSADEYKSFAVNYKNNTAGQLYALSADIDLGGWSVFDGKDASNNTSTHNNANPWYATIDGRGHFVNNVATTHGLFANLSTGTIKNIAYTNVNKAVNGGGLISNTSNGTIENVYVQGVITKGSAQGGLIAVPYSSAVVKNVVVDVEYTATGSDAYALTNQNDNGIYTNVFAISDTASALFGGSPSQTTNVSLLGDLTDINYADLNGNGYWKVIGNQLYFGSHCLTSSVDVDLSKTNNSIDLEGTLLTASKVNSVKVGSTAVTYTVSGNTLVVDGTANTGLTRGDVLATITDTDGKRLTVNFYVADKIISSADDYKAFAVNYKNNTAGQLYALSANIDLGGWNLATGTYNGGTSTHNIDATWNATIDGRGYFVNNVATTHGLFPTVGSGKIMNIAYTNVAKAANGGGLISNTSNGTIENVYVQGTITKGSGNQGGIINNPYAAFTVKNVVVDVEYTATGTNAYALAFATDNGAYTNVFAVSKTASALFGGNPNTQTNVGLYSDIASVPKDSLKNKGYWKVSDGKLYFGNLLVE